MSMHHLKKPPYAGRVKDWILSRMKRLSAQRTWSNQIYLDLIDWNCID
jgi:hypothetical protein